MVNPLAVIIEQARHAVIDPTAPSAAAAAGSTARLLIPLSVTVALVIVTAWVYKRNYAMVAERL